MAKYLDPEALKELDQYRKKIFELRAEAYAKFKIDVLDNDTLSALSIYEIVSQYDTDYNINFARNGEDALSQGVKIEQKASRVEKKKRSGEYPEAQFQFHAMGDLEYPRYILVSRDKTDLKLIRIYDISSPANVAVIQNYLLAQRSQWLERGRLDESKMKRDVISIGESTLEQLTGVTRTTVQGCEVIQG
jgi:hypothetical protein